MVKDMAVIHIKPPSLRPNKNQKQNKNMKKNTIRLDENTLRKIVAESVKKVLKEGYDSNEARVDDVMRNLLLQVKAAYNRLDRISRKRGVEDSDALNRAFNVVLDCKESFKNNGFNLDTRATLPTDALPYGYENIEDY